MKDRQKIVDVMVSWIGATQGDAKHKEIIDTYNKKRPLPRKHKMSYTEYWCAATVSAAALKCGYDDFIPFECSCGKLIEQAKALSIWQELDSYMPSKGDFIIYDWADDGKGDDTTGHDHVGIVEYVDKNSFTVIEGNYNKAVRRRTVKRDARYIRGFICPMYDDDSVVHYIVVRGDTTTKIAKRYGCSITDLVNWNIKKYPTMTKNFIRVGWDLEVHV